MKATSCHEWLTNRQYWQLQFSVLFNSDSCVHEFEWRGIKMENRLRIASRKPLLKHRVSR